MSRIYLIALFFLSAVFAAQAGVNVTKNENELIKVSVYYECLCPDSIRFITQQFFPAYGGLKGYIKMDWVPYGFATQKKVGKGWEFKCQHGPKECKGDMYHACALEFNKGEETTVRFINCVMSLSDPSSTGGIKKCAKHFELNWADVSDCATGIHGEYLLANYGNRTKEVSPPISFIPTIIFNNKFDKNLQDMAMTNFAKAACSLISDPKPNICDYEKRPKYLLV